MISRLGAGRQNGSDNCSLLLAAPTAWQPEAPGIRMRETEKVSST